MKLANVFLVCFGTKSFNNTTMYSPNMRSRIGIGCLISIQHSILSNFCILYFAFLAWPYIDSSCLLICSVDNWIFDDTPFSVALLSLDNKKATISDYFVRLLSLPASPFSSTSFLLYRRNNWTGSHVEQVTIVDSGAT